MATAQLTNAFAKLFPPAWPEPVVRTAAGLLGLHQLSATYDAVHLAPEAGAASFAERLLTHLRVTCRVPDSDNVFSRHGAVCFGRNLG